MFDLLRLIFPKEKILDHFRIRPCPEVDYPKRNNKDCKKQSFNRVGVISTRQTNSNYQSDNSKKAKHNAEDIHFLKSYLKIISRRADNNKYTKQQYRLSDG